MKNKNNLPVIIGFGIALLAGVSSVLLFISSKKDVSQLKGRQTMAKGLKETMDLFYRYDAASKYLSSFPSEVRKPKLPIAIPTPNEEEMTDGEPSSEWTHKKLNYSWTSIPIKSALSVISSLNAAAIDGWIITDMDFAALQDGENAKLEVVIESSRRIVGQE